MKGFAEWLAARRYRMILLAAALVMVPGLGIVGQAIVVFVVLRRGAAEGALIAGAASVLIAVTMTMAGGNAGAHIAVVLLSWLPAFALALLLRFSRSLSMTLQTATVVVLGLVTLLFALGDPVARAQRLLTQYADQLGERIGPLSEPAIAAWSQVLVGTVAGAVLLVSVAALFIGRWWQGALQRPGGFGEEFRQLRLGMVLCAVASVVFIAAWLTGFVWLQNITLVLLSAYLLQGLSVAHAFVGVTAGGSGPLWLGGLYFFLILAMQFAVPAIAGLGFLDSWFNFRSRLARR